MYLAIELERIIWAIKFCGFDSILFLLSSNSSLLTGSNELASCLKCGSLLNAYQWPRLIFYTEPGGHVCSICTFAITPMIKVISFYF